MNNNLEKVKKEVNLVDYIRQNAPGKIKKIGNGIYGINPCPICGHNDNFRIYENTNSYNCFSENKGGDILNYMQEVEHLSFKEAKEKLYKITNTPLEDYKPTFKQEVVKKTETKELEAINNFVMQGYNKMEDKQELIDYLKTRNIGEDAITKYHLFISKDEYGTKRLYIPILEQGKAIAYLGRRTDQETELRYKNSKGNIKPFNFEYLKQEPSKNELLFICEGVFDAISIEEQGKKAIALNSTQNVSKLIDEIKENKQTATKYKYVIATDNDKAGEKAKENLQKELTDLNIINYYVEIPKEYNDINEWYCASKSNFKSELEEQIIYNKYTNKTIDYYLGNYYDEIKNYNDEKAIRKTGFTLLDKCLNGGIRQGLYVIGAIPSLGKTTFTLQLADNIAKSGQKVIIFSLEQSRFELVSKAISRVTFERSPGNARSHNSIMQGNIDDIVVNAMEQYSNTIAPNEIIEEGNFSFSIEDLKNYIKDYIATTGNRPTIFIDYLQILTPSDTKLSDKQQLDYNITTLKRISRDYQIPIIVISSFNRSNYGQVASFEAFKESGGIEYTADVLLTMQLKIMKDDNLKYNSNGNPDKTTKIKIDEAKRKTPREVQLVCLKNRSGQTFTINYDFNTVFNDFIEKDLEER